MAIRLRITEPGYPPREVEHVKPMLTIGRSSGCDVRVDDSSASSRHARLSVYTDCVILQDLRSTNGTLVDGVTVADNCEVGLGSVVELGQGGARVEIVSGPAALRPVDAPEQAVESAQPESSSLSPVLLIGCGFFFLACCGVIALVTGTLIYQQIPSTDSITSVRDSGSIGQAVGLAVVGYEAKGANTKYGKVGTGSAFAVTRDGFLLTNRHVVEAASDRKLRSQIANAFSKAGADVDVRMRVWVIFEGDVYAAKVLYTSTEFDLSVLKVQRADGPYFRLSRAADYATLTEVYTIGFPGASMIPITDQERMIEANSGRPQSSVGSLFKSDDFRYVAGAGTINKTTLDSAIQRIQHNAPMSPGNSGGPLCSNDGRVIGINTWVAAKQEEVKLAQMLSQLRREIDAIVPDAAWVD